MSDDSFTVYGIHHGADASARTNLIGDRPALEIDTDGGWMSVCPKGAGDFDPSEDHERFANELVTAAEQYRDAVAGARFWAEFDRPPDDVPADVPADVGAER